jgi:hypothetical protein
MDKRDLVGVCCPFNHDLFPQGISQEKLGIVFLPWHKYMVVLPLIERQWVYSQEYLRAHPQPKHYKNGCFRLTQEQYIFLGIKCRVCATKSTLFN